MNLYPSPQADGRSMLPMDGSNKRQAVDLKRMTASLDPPFLVRSEDDCEEFCKPGRVFSVERTAYTEEAKNSNHDASTSNMFNKRGRSQILLFVIAKVFDRSFNYLPMTLYDPSREHNTNLSAFGIAYSGHTPKPLDGITKAPVKVNLAKGHPPLEDYSLIEYSKVQTMEMNVMVENIGMLEFESRQTFDNNFRETLFDNDRGPQYSGTTSMSPNNKESIPSSDGIEACGPVLSSQGIGSLSSTKCHSFFNVGRVFMTAWTEPAGFTAKNSNPGIWTTPGGSKVFSKARPFVVIRQWGQYCWCLPLYTYGRQGTSKASVRAQDHAIVYDWKAKISKHAAEEGIFATEPIGIVLDNSQTWFDPMTRINFTQCYTIQHNLEVVQIGQIHDGDLHRLNEMFVAMIINNSLRFTSTTSSSYDARFTTGTQYHLRPMASASMLGRRSTQLNDATNTRNRHHHRRVL